MISDEVTVNGYIKIPYPFMNEYLNSIKRLKGRNKYKDFPDFVMQPLECLDNAIVSFGYNFRFETDFEKILKERFERFLEEIKFLFASLIINIDDKEYFFYEYVWDGEEIQKSENKICNI